MEYLRLQKFFIHWAKEQNFMNLLTKEPFLELNTQHIHVVPNSVCACVSVLVSVAT